MSNNPTPSVFSYKDYREFLKDQIRRFPNSGRGIRARLAQAIRCQLPFITHVLAGRNHLSQEHAEAVARFLSLTKSETEYFLLLVNYNRASTPELQRFLLKLLNDKAEGSRLLKTQLKIGDSLRPEDQTRYYSHWLYAATHMALTIPELQTRAELCKRLRVSPEVLQEVLEFLVSRGFAAKEGTAYKPLRSFLHLEKSAPAVLSHHTNWRHRAVESLIHEREHDMHYSGAISCSRKDLARIRERIALALVDCIDIARTSNEETLCGLCLDVFEL